ncbi:MULTISPECIES: transposase domain-containing protein [Bradyrhizobium]|uniref:transposase domain-containing protein n=1 Tax=Bradyrhizobium centrosematis TaxID=1300039 RepID=UPI0035B5DFD3
MLTTITTCRINDVDPKGWLTDILARIADLPAPRPRELLPDNGSCSAKPTSPPMSGRPDRHAAPS